MGSGGGDMPVHTSIGIADMTTLSLRAPSYPKKGVPKCPACAESMERTGRTSLMRILIGSKRYYCWNCCRGYLRFLGLSIPL